MQRDLTPPRRCAHTLPASLLFSCLIVREQEEHRIERTPSRTYSICLERSNLTFLKNLRTVFNRTRKDRFSYRNKRIFHQETQTDLYFVRRQPAVEKWTTHAFRRRIYERIWSQIETAYIGTAINVIAIDISDILSGNYLQCGRMCPRICRRSLAR